MPAVNEREGPRVTEYTIIKIVYTIPVCPVHRCDMRSQSGGRGGALRYYKCPVPGCPCRGRGSRRRA